MEVSDPSFLYNSPSPIIVGPGSIPSNSKTSAVLKLLVEDLVTFILSPHLLPSTNFSLHRFISDLRLQYIHIFVTIPLQTLAGLQCGYQMTTVTGCVFTCPPSTFASYPNQSSKVTVIHRGREETPPGSESLSFEWVAMISLDSRTTLVNARRSLTRSFSFR